MRNIKKVADKSKVVCPNMILPLYYSIKNDAVYFQPGNDRFFVTNLINPNEPKDIIEAVERWKRL